MSTRIRLRRMGKKKQPFYRIVVLDSRNPRDSQAIEEIGTYNPVSRPGRITLKENRVYDWLEKGAVPSDTVASLFRRIGVMRKWSLQKAGQDVSDHQIKTELVETTKPKARNKKSAKAAEPETKAAAEDKAPAAAEAETPAEVEAAAPATEEPEATAEASAPATEEPEATAEVAAPAEDQPTVEAEVAAPAAEEAKAPPPEAEVKKTDE